MDIGMVGLGRMGSNMAERLRRGGHRVVAYDRAPDTRKHATASGLTAADSLEHLAEQLASPRVVWIMVPSGNPTEGAMSALKDVLDPGDIVVDGGNSNYKDSMRRGADFHRDGLRLIDAGVSGGVWGLEDGYCLMEGGDGIHHHLGVDQPVHKCHFAFPGFFQLFFHVRAGIEKLIGVVKFL